MQFFYAALFFLLLGQMSFSMTCDVAVNSNKVQTYREFKSQLAQAIDAKSAEAHQLHSLIQKSNQNIKLYATEIAAAKLARSWQDWFGIRHVRGIFFKPRPQQLTYETAVNNHRQELRTLADAQKSYKRINDARLVPNGQGRLNQFFVRSLTPLIKRSLIVPEGQTISKIEVISLLSDAVDYSKPVHRSALSKMTIQSQVRVTVGKQKHNLIFETIYEPSMDRIVKMGIVEPSSKSKDYDWILAGYVHRSGLAEIAPHTSLQKYVEKKKLNISLEKMQTIQRRTMNERALKRQVDSVITYADSRRDSSSEDFVVSYFKYLAFDGHPFSMAFMPPTRWIIFNLTLPHNTQSSIAQVLDNATQKHNQGIEYGLTDIQKDLKGKLAPHELPPIELKSPDVDSNTWVEQINDMSYKDLSPALQTQVAEQIKDAVDIDLFRSNSIEVGVDPLDNSKDLTNDGAVDVETTTEPSAATDSTDTSYTDTSSSSSSMD